MGLGIHSVDHAGSEGLNGGDATPEGWRGRERDGEEVGGLKLTSGSARQRHGNRCGTGLSFRAERMFIGLTHTDTHRHTHTHRWSLPLARNTEASTMGIMLIDASAA